MKCTIIARANIALVKYWGKRHHELRLPMNDSLGLTLDGLSSKTTIEFTGKVVTDQISLNGEVLNPGDRRRDRISDQLDRVRRFTGRTDSVRMASENNFPTGAGLASSASGMIALTVASVLAAEAMSYHEMTTADWQQISLLARLASGSACRCAFGGFVHWRAGELADGSDSLAVQHAPETAWPDLRLLVALVSEAEKPVSSTAGMARSVETSPLYRFWPELVAADLKELIIAIADRDFDRLGRVAERNAMAMHATTTTAFPPYSYWLSESLIVLKALWAWRETDNLRGYVTMDAGPQVKVLCLASDEADITEKLDSLPEVKRVMSFGPGPGPQLSAEHLF